MASETQIRIVVDSGQANRELDKLERNLKDTEGQSKKTGRSLRDLGKSFARIGASLVAITAAFGVFIRNQIQAGDQILKTADKIGITTDALQEYRFAAELSGVAQQQLDMGLQRFSRRAAEAAKGTGVMAKEFEALGISLRDSSGELRAVEEVMLDYADAIAATTDPQEQLRLAFKAFDSEGAALVNLFRQGRIGIEEMAQELQDMGGVIDRQSLQQMADLNDQMTKFSNLLQGRVNVFMRQFLTLLERWDVIEPTFRLDFRTVEEAAERYETLEHVIQANENAIKELRAAERGHGQMARGNADRQIENLNRINARRKVELQLVGAVLDRLREGGVDQAFIDEQERLAEIERLRIERLTELELAYNRVFSAELKQLDHLHDLKLLYDEGIISLDEFSDRVRELTGVFAQVDKEIDALFDDDDMWGFKQGADDAREFSAVMQDELARASVRAIEDMADAMVDFALTGEQSFADMTESILTNIAKMIVQMQILNALGANVGGTGFREGSFLGGLFGAANGAAFNKGVQQFARGGVVNAPTAFGMRGGLGVMGEKGPEAILPLQRQGGQLGVAGSPVNIVVNNNASGADADVAVSEDGTNIEVIVTDIVRAQLGSGGLDKSLRTNFGVQRRGR